MTRYRDDFPCPVAFAEQQVDRHARRDSRRRRRAASSTRQRRRSTRTSPTSSTAASSSRGRARTRVLVPSPRDVPSYDLKPEMSAREVASRVSAALGDGYRFCVVNFANPDMVGHTGVIPAVVQAVETADACLGEVVEATHAAGRRLPRDRRPRQRREAPRGRRRQPAHGAHDEPRAARSSRAKGAALRDGGELSDLAPTVLALLGLEPPPR